ncbi:DUF4352 domain-containing protein [Alkalihalobacillus sp. 1P02AB]|uniref:DUF4352 domain-containing protein n=1 Tax=Alkalihalobacillus sp. 1P02AB TaxID=3132260 RepID=UPI0039A4B922
MKKMMTAVGITLLAGSLLVACNNDDGAGAPEDTGSDERVNDVADGDSSENDSTTNNGIDDEVEENNDGDSGESEGPVSSEEFEDQLDLSIGDTGQVSSTLGAFEMTVDSISKEVELDGKSSPLDFYLVVDVTLKNIGDKTYNAEDIAGSYRITNVPDGSGQSDITNNLDSIDKLTGDLEPGEEISGKLVFDVQGEGEQYLKINGGLIASDAVHNDTVWTFTEDEME